jgi:hypothetical protein
VGPVPIKNILKVFKFHPNLIGSKMDFSELKKFQIKYSCDGFEPRNNMPYSKWTFHIQSKMDLPDLKWKLN